MHGKKPVRLILIFFAALALVDRGLATPERSGAAETAALLAPASSSEELCLLSAAELARQIRGGSLKSETLVQAFQQRIQRINQKYNAIVTLNPDALRRARELDQMQDRGQILGPLHGVPVVVKDSYSTRGLRTTAGYAPLRDFVPEEDAVAVQLLLEAGAVILGKGNLPPLASDMQTDNEIFGRTNNAWDLNRTAGGSTGGDAVAVATGMAALGFGSDIAGSLRVPTAFNGVYGMKPSWGVISFQGHIPPVPGEVDGVHDLAVLGPVARNAEDLELAFSVLARGHRGDRSVIPLPALTPQSRHGLQLQRLRIAWAETPGGVPVQADIRKAMRAFVDRLGASGATVTAAAPLDFDYQEAWHVWGGIVGHQGGYDRSNLARWFGDLFTRSARAPNPMQAEIVAPISVPRYMELLNRQRRLITAMENFLEPYDVYLTPVSSTTAFAHQTPDGSYGVFRVYDRALDVDGQAVAYYVATQSQATIFTVTENPVVSMPIGRDRQGLPIGIQVVGKRYRDYELLAIVRQLESVATAMQGNAEPRSNERRQPAHEHSIHLLRRPLPLVEIGMQQSEVKQYAANGSGQ
ncbi:MAG: amidase [Leptospirales bacterium]|nr:amidase [Leptospirales bacterium]